MAPVRFRGVLTGIDRRTGEGLLCRTGDGRIIAVRPAERTGGVR